MTKIEIVLLMLTTVLVGMYVQIGSLNRSVNKLKEYSLTQTNTVYIVEVHNETMMDLLEEINVNN